ncbi:MAG: response regulator [Deltaproteobacteria bacterium]|nr:response regulator [Deltaproteobacteria bacterium]
MNDTRRYLLLVEDDPTDEKLALRALARSSREVPIVIARDGALALEHLIVPSDAGDATPPRLPALVLLDLKLPRIDGLEVLRRIRADPRARFVPVVILTASREDRDLLESYSLGANAYVRKPLDFDEFAAAMGAIAQFWLGLNEPAPRGVS